MALPKRLTRKRWAAIALSRLGPLIAPRRTALRVVDDSADLDIAPPLLVEWPAGRRLPRVGLVEDAAADPYWTKYRRFLQNNSIPFRMVDIHGDSWLSRAGRPRSARLASGRAAVGAGRSPPQDLLT